MNSFFTASFDMQRHPIKNAKRKTQEKYIKALTYMIEKTINEKIIDRPDDKAYITERLHLYQAQVLDNASITGIEETSAASCLSAFTKFWRRKYLYMLLCDAALLLLDKSSVFYSASILKDEIPSKLQLNIEQIVSLLYSKQEIEKKYLPVSYLIEQFRINNEFYAQKERRIIVTANMSAGKSTLINALAGKRIARTSQEVCTGNVCYLFNKPFEDGRIHLQTKMLNLDASTDDLRKFDWEQQICIASCFTSMISKKFRVCLIDTPGVDAALYKEHRERTQNVLLNGQYDIIIYVVSPTNLGSDAEKEQLRWMAENLQKEKILFVLNKLDDFDESTDDIEESIRGLKEDLRKEGFNNSVICPVSAYFSYLIKLKITEHPLSEDELDEYTLYSKKFKRASYDLSKYYEGTQCLPTDSEEIKLCKCVGLYGLEKIIYGGNL